MSSNADEEASDTLKITGEEHHVKDVKVIDEMTEKAVFCPSAFNKLYNILDSFLEKFLWKDAALSTDARPIFTKAERYNIFFYIIGIMCYKVRTSCLPLHTSVLSDFPHIAFHSSVISSSQQPISILLHPRIPESRRTKQISSASSSTTDPSGPSPWIDLKNGVIPSSRIRATWTVSTRRLTVSAPSSSAPS